MRPSRTSLLLLGSLCVLAASLPTHAARSGGGKTRTVSADSTPPVISVPSSQVAEASSTQGSMVSYTVTASDDVDRRVDVTCIPASGAVFALGNTTVNCVSTDSSGNRAAASFLVTVRDTVVPRLGLPGTLGATAADSSGATVAFSVSANDAVDPAPTLRCSRESGSVFPVGSTAVQCSAEDASGNLSDGSFVVTVTLDSAPVVAADTAAQPDPVSTGSATLSWSAPTTRADGAPLAISELSGYEIYVLSESTGESTVIPISDPLLTEYTLNGLPADIYHFAIGALDTAGLVSELLAVVSKDLR